MIRLGALRDDRGLVERGLGHLVWLERQCHEGEHYRFPGHLGLGPDDDLHDSGDEQPLEAAAMIDAAAAAFEITGEPWPRRSPNVRGRGSWATTGSAGRSACCRAAPATMPSRHTG